MKLISCHDGKLHALEASGLAGSVAKTFRTGLPALDALPPGGAFARGAVHELLTAPGDGQPFFLAALLARGAGRRDKETGGEARDKVTGGQGDKETEGSEGGEIRDKGTRGHGDKGTEAKSTASAFSSPLVSLSPCPLVFPPPFSSPIIWSDPHHELYPPALAAMGIPLERVFLLRPRDDAEQIWAVAECLRCRGVGAVVAALPPRLSRVQVRRLQLAAERGGSAAVLIRPLARHGGRPPDVYAAATRWLVAPMPGERIVQRWRIQLIHGHGGRVGETIVLEHHRDNTLEPQQRVQARPVREVAQLAHRPATPQPAASAVATRRTA